MLYITIMVVALSATAVLYMLMPACGVCGEKFCFGNHEAEQFYPIGNDSPQTVRPNQPKTNQTTTRLTETERAGADYLQSLYFIGDSRTNALRLYDIPADHIFAEDGLNHERALTERVVELEGQTLVSIPDAVKVALPEIMIVNFGINGISWWTEDEFIRLYGELVDALLESSPESILVIEAVMPVAYYYEQKPAADGGVTNEEIDEINRRLYQLAQEKGCYYLATNEVMKNAENDLKDEFTADGLHFTKAAYATILDYIETHAIIKQ